MSYLGVGSNFSLCTTPAGECDVTAVGVRGDWLGTAVGVLFLRGELRANGFLDGVTVGVTVGVEGPRLTPPPAPPPPSGALGVAMFIGDCLSVSE